MSKRYTEILPKMDASQAIEVKHYTCPECGESAIDDVGSLKPKEKPALVGWCDTDWGLQMIVECPKCFTKYRFHGTADLATKKILISSSTPCVAICSPSISAIPRKSWTKTKK